MGNSTSISYFTRFTQINLLKTKKNTAKGHFAYLSSDWAGSCKNLDSFSLAEVRTLKLGFSALTRLLPPLISLPPLLPC